MADVPWRAGRTGQSPIDTSSNKGALQWSSLAGDFSSIGYVPNGPVIGAGPVIYVGSQDGKLFAFNADGSVRWTYDTGIGGYLTAAAIGDFDTIYATNGNLYAITAEGALLWEFVPPGPGIPFEPAVGGDGTIYFGDQCGNFYALTTGGSVK